MTQNDGHTLDIKVRLRRQFRQLRDTIDAGIRAQHNLTILTRLQSLPEIVEAKTLFSYISYGSETDTHNFLDWLLVTGKQVLVPKITSDGHMEPVVFNSWSSVNTDTNGILVPDDPLYYHGNIDVCITPGLAFSADGTRLGQGEGYYDRWFASHQVRFIIAPAFECQLSTQLPAEIHDTPVNIIVTEQRIIRVS